MLGRTVSARVKNPVQAGNGGEVNNVPGFVWKHCVYLLLHTPEKAKDIDLEHILNFSVEQSARHAESVEMPALFTAPSSLS